MSVFCRIGSSEKTCIAEDAKRTVFCRIGSSEIELTRKEA